MKIIPAILSLFDYKPEKSTFYGNVPLSSNTFHGKNGTYLDFDFKKPTKINLITLFEKGENVTDFEIYYKEKNQFKMFYKQNRISKLRVCAFDDIITTKIRIKILNTRKGYFKQIDAYIYNLPKKQCKFRKTAYMLAEVQNKTDPNNLKCYNNFNVIGCIRMNEKGEIFFPNVKNEFGEFNGKERFESALAMIREHTESPAIAVTILSSDYIKAFKNQNTVSNIERFLSKYNLDGISFDWEYPKNIYEWRVFDKFIVELKRKIGNKKITLALASWLRYRFSKTAVNCIDTVEVMTYDNMKRDIDGHHSEFFSDCANAVNHFIKMGFDTSQLDLGLPYYARPVDSAGYWKDYKDEVDKMDKFTNVVSGDYRDIDAEKKQIIVKDRFYNSCQMIEDKITFCIYADVGGVMIWELGADTSSNHELCLSKTLNDTVRKRLK